MTPPRASIGWPSLAADERGAWESGRDGSEVRPGSLGEQAARRLDDLGLVLGALVDVPVSMLSDDEVRRELASVEAARRTLEARSCRLTSALTSRAGVRLLCVLDHDAAVEAEQRKHARREVHLVRGRDGIVRINGGQSGLQGELLLTTWHAFRRPDRPGEHRTPGQRGADALADLCRAALGEEGADRIEARMTSDALAPACAGTTGRAAMAAADAAGTGAATTGPRGRIAGDRTPRRGPKRQHGVQPHISVTIDLGTLLTGEGVAEPDWSGPIPWGALRDQLAGADLTFIAVRNEVPVAVTTKTRYIPVGVWSAVKRRDKGCIRVHCDAPASWCQVAHLADWFTDGGKLTLDTAGLLCTSDHREFDACRLAVTWTDGRPIVHPPDQPPDSTQPPTTGCRSEAERDPPGDPP